MSAQDFTSKYYFDPAELRILPKEHREYGLLLESTCGDLEYLASELLLFLGYTRPGTFLEFIDNELQPLISENEAAIRRELSQGNPIGKTIWRHHFLNITLRVIEEVEEGIVESFESLLEYNILEFASYLSFATSNIGRLAMAHAMCHEGLIDGIGSQYNLAFRGGVGGRNSGKVRKANARLQMTPEELRTEKAKWVSKSQPEREAARFLAEKYRCSTDYIRKYLNRP